MVTYKELKKGKKYKLGDIIVGKFLRLEKDANGDVLIFTGSQYGEIGENTIEPYDEDDFEEIRRTEGGSKKNKRKTKKITNKKKRRTMRNRK